MTLAMKAEVNAIVAHTVAMEAIADAQLRHEVGGELFEDAGADAIDDVFLIAAFEDDRVDSFEVEQLPEQQSGWSGSDDSNLRAHPRSL
jgi:hypothetical protein